MFNHVHVRVHSADGFFGGLSLRPTNIAHPMKNLALEVAQIYNIMVDDA